MSRLPAFVMAIAGVLMSIGCAPPPPATTARDTSADVAAINALASREIAAFASMDVATITAVFAPRVIAMPPGEPAIQGRDALVKWAQAIHEQFTVQGEYTASNVDVAGDLAVHRFTGRLTLTPKSGGGKPISESIKGLHVLQRQADGTWQITQDVWNVDHPPAAAGEK